MRDRLIRFAATGGYAGYCPKAPGLAGSFVGLGWWWLLRQLPFDLLYWSAALAVALLAVWCTGVAAKSLGRHDPPEVVLDEIVAVPVALGPFTGGWCVLAFVLFRVFDVWKPGPVDEAQQLPGGWGIVADDLVAAGLAWVVTFAVPLLAGSFTG
jgi:phosphatidylglycerophosphatase A